MDDVLLAMVKVGSREKLSPKMVKRLEWKLIGLPFVFRGRELSRDSRGIAVKIPHYARTLSPT
eukprot:137353-Prorocentrum_lima.AAC.1